jgi:hypothetical protein
MWCHYCDKNNHNTADCRAVAKFKQQKNNKAFFEAKAGPGKKSLAFLFEDINSLTRQLKPVKLQAVRREQGRLNPSSLFSTEINLTTSSDKCEGGINPENGHE